MMFALTVLVESGFMVLLQALLLQMQHFHQRNPHMHPLSSTEKFLIATAFWVVFCISGRIFHFLVQILGSIVSSAHAEHAEDKIINQAHYTRQFGFGTIVYNIMATYMIHHTINFFLETVVPLWEELNRDGAGVQQKIEVRIGQSFGGLRELGRTMMKKSRHEWNQGEKKKSVVSESGQLICLERHKVEDQRGRTLDWDIVVEKSALDEMKEILGPPGGFGELGFVVEKDGVSFQAMGVGTKFNLRFLINEKGDGPRRKRKKSRANKV